MRIHLDVERVVLRGLPVEPAHRAGLIRALERELAAQLAATPPQRWAQDDIAVVTLPPVHVRLPAARHPAAPGPPSPAPGMATGIAGGVTQALTALRGDRR
ncbi:hypothetical protein ACFW9U_26755 [Rhodococcus aetherivorans]|uniref:hypothetical protein n=1 Tax=Rhodococcus aetherivorans TaxID=191292 RepID=UPI00366CE5F5